MTQGTPHIGILEWTQRWGVAADRRGQQGPGGRDEDEHVLTGQHQVLRENKLFVIYFHQFWGKFHDFIQAHLGAKEF